MHRLADRENSGFAHGSKEQFEAPSPGEKSIKQVQIYTDGACKGNPGPGGFGAVLIYKGNRKELSQGFRWTTNNRMEMLALIHALKALKEPCELDIYSDSRYLLNALEQGYLDKWKQNGWQIKKKEPVRNRDLWMELDLCLLQHKPSYIWVKGHADNDENNRCDWLAVKAIKAEGLEIDIGYELVKRFPSEDNG